MRISETYGPGDFRLLKLFRALDRGRFLIIGSGQNRRQAIHVRDLVQGLLLAATHPAAVGETFVLAGQETMTTREMVEHVARALGRTAPRWHVPAVAVPRGRRDDGEDALALGNSAAAAPAAPGFLSQIVRVFHRQGAAPARLYAPRCRLRRVRSRPPIGTASRDYLLGALAAGRALGDGRDLLRHDAHLLAVQPEDDPHARLRARR